MLKVTELGGNINLSMLVPEFNKGISPLSTSSPFKYLNPQNSFFYNIRCILNFFLKFFDKLGGVELFIHIKLPINFLDSKISSINTLRYACSLSSHCTKIKLSSVSNSLVMVSRFFIKVSQVEWLKDSLPVL